MKTQGALSLYHKLIMLMMRAKRHMFAACDSWEITPVQGMLLISLAKESPRTMNDLADRMGCDASNITGLIDRLEANKYIERLADPGDRRVKKIHLTNQGCDCRKALLDALCLAEAIDLSRLSEDEVKSLNSIIAKLV